MGNYHSEAGQLHKESRLAASKFDSFEIHFLQVCIIFSYYYYYDYYDYDYYYSKRKHGKKWLIVTMVKV